MKLLLILFSTLFLFSSCSTISVNSDFDPEADFATFNKFKIHSPERKTNRMKNNPILDKKIARTITEELERRGYQESRNPDFKVFFFTGSKEDIDVYTTYRVGRWGKRWVRDVNVRKSREGTMVIDFIDTKSNEAVWRGWGEGIKIRQEDSDKIIKEVVSKILEQFPPKK